MANLADRVKDTTTTTGTGSITLAGSPPTGFRTFAAGFGATSQSVSYCIDDGAGNWETGIGTFDGTTGLTRDTVRASSNSNALVSFAAGTKNVYCTAAAPDVGALVLTPVSGTSVTAADRCDYLLNNVAATAVTAPTSFTAGFRFGVTPNNGLTGSGGNTVDFGAKSVKSRTGTYSGVITLDMCMPMEFVAIDTSTWWAK